MSMPRRAARPGFTLIEVMIVLAIIALVGAAVMPALASVTGANARSAAGQLSGAMRYVFDTAALRHQTCRIALDLEARAWWAECTSDRAYAEAADGGATRAEDDEELAARFPDERDADVRRLLARARFGEFRDRLVGKRELPGSSAFGEVWTQHQREPVSKGLAYVYFFPQAQAEAAQVPVVDGSNVYTIVLQPFTGRARVVAGKVEVPR